MMVYFHDFCEWHNLTQVLQLEPCIPLTYLSKMHKMSIFVIFAQNWQTYWNTMWHTQLGRWPNHDKQSYEGLIEVSLWHGTLFVPFFLRWKSLTFGKISTLDRFDDLKLSQSSFLGPNIHDNRKVQILAQKKFSEVFKILTKIFQNMTWDTFRAHQPQLSIFQVDLDQEWYFWFFIIKILSEIVPKLCV